LSGISSSLYPNMTVRESFDLGLRLRRTPKPQIRERVNSVDDILGLLESREISSDRTFASTG
jgi:ABC-type sugar transport system ATPase subunit